MDAAFWGRDCKFEWRTASRLRHGQALAMREQQHGLRRIHHVAAGSKIVMKFARSKLAMPDQIKRAVHEGGPTSAHGGVAESDPPDYASRPLPIATKQI